MFFANEIERIIRDGWETNAKFAQDAGITPAQITKYIRNGELPGPEKLGSLLGALNAHDSKCLLRAFFQDQIRVAEVPYEVSVMDFGCCRSGNEEPCDPKLHQTLLMLEARANAHPRLRRILEDLAQW